MIWYTSRSVLLFFLIVPHLREDGANVTYASGSNSRNQGHSADQRALARVRLQPLDFSPSLLCAHPGAVCVHFHGTIRPEKQEMGAYLFLMFYQEIKDTWPPMARRNRRQSG